MSSIGPVTLDAPCEEWPGFRNPKGYGKVRREGRDHLAHRWAWEQANGPIPDGLWVLHHCDNPPCVNLEHLFLGTAKDNVMDAILKGRRAPQRTLRATHCKNGHEFTPDNTMVGSQGNGQPSRRCRTCRNAYRRSHRRPSQRKADHWTRHAV